MQDGVENFIFIGRCRRLESQYTTKVQIQLRRRCDGGTEQWRLCVNFVISVRFVFPFFWWDNRRKSCVWCPYTRERERAYRICTKVSYPNFILVVVEMCWWLIQHQLGVWCVYEHEQVKIRLSPFTSSIRPMWRNISGTSGSFLVHTHLRNFQNVSKFSFKVL